MKTTITLESKQVGIICGVLGSTKVLDLFEEPTKTDINNIVKDLFSQMQDNINKDIESKNNVTQEEKQKIINLFTKDLKKEKKDIK